MQTVLAQLTVTLTPTNYNGYNISCFGKRDGSIAATVTAGGTGSYTYEWSVDQTTPTVTGLAAGYYRVKVIDANGESAETEITLTQPEVLNLDKAVHIYSNSYNVTCHFCADGIVNTQPVNGIAPYSYIWSDGGATQNRTGIDAGSYLVMVTDANGCTAAQDVAVTAPDRNDWTMTGNAGTNPSNQFIGTTDNKDLVFKTNNSERLRVNANGGVKINSLSGNGTQLLLVDDNGLLLKQNPNIPIGLSTIWMTNGNLTTANHYIGTNNTQPLIFKTDVNASATLGEKMRIMPDGKVGIGTNNPDVLFHIMGNKLLNPSQQPVALMKIESESPNTCGLVFENIPAMGSAKQGAKFQLTGDGVFSIWNTSSTGSLGGGKPCIAIKDGTTVAGKVFIGGLPSEILNPQTGSINYRLYVMGG
ncbi:MAG TPA: SprB repeat-containing protein, partial [Bacteroidia bacterium]|nr:SprB repeat-containing protein [Bacteroidia bacterium]